MIESMDKICAANECLKAAHDSYKRDYNAAILVSNHGESRLKKRMDKLNHKKMRLLRQMAILMLQMTTLWKSMLEGKVWFPIGLP
jgi:hypothetical protein